MTNDEIRQELERLIQSERQNTKQMLAVLRAAAKERAYLEFGYSSLSDWLTLGFKYANGSAQRRLNAIRVLQSVPDAQEKLLSGELNLTNLNRAQTIFNAQEKITGVKITTEAKAEAIKKIENQREDEACKILLTKFPDAAPKIAKPRRRRISANLTRVTLDLTDEQLDRFERMKEVWSHKLPNADDEALVEHAINFVLQREDPLEHKSKRAIESDQAPSAAQVRRDVIQSSGGGCVFTHPASGHVCNNRVRIETDHARAKGTGGDDSRENLRPLCREHNMYMAEKTYGKKHMAKFRKRSAANQLSFLDGEGSSKI